MAQKLKCMVEDLLHRLLITVEPLLILWVCVSRGVHTLFWLLGRSR